ncbi:MAG: protein kinase [Pirellula sp.]
MYEALQADQRQRWKRGERERVQFYLDKYPSLSRDIDALTNLVCSEIALREAHGESPKLDEYLKSFPQCESGLRRQFTLIQNSPFETVQAAPPQAHALTQVPDVHTQYDAVPDSVPVAEPEHATQVLEPPPQEASPAKQSDTDFGGNFETIQRDTQGEVLEAHASELSCFPKVPGFEILSELGRGGMGIVYRARQLSANRTVALKVVRNELLDTLPSATRASTLERFRTEAQAAARLQHDNLVSVYEIGEAPPTSPGSSPLRYYAMRFVEGRSLFDVVRDGPLENKRAATYMEQVARALQAAHDQGILHRDLKPHNVMVDRNTDRPLVTDFGLAKFIEGSDSLTYAGEIMGTPSYMSPEQATDAGKVTASADLYSIGATFYHLLTGRAPFQASNVAETIRQIIQKDPVAPRHLNTSIDRDLETICLKCLQKDPSRRYASCGALAEDLQLYLAGRPIIARPVGHFERIWRWCRRNPIPAALTGTAAVLACATMLSIVIGYRNTTAALAASESRLQKALEVVDELFTRVSEDELLNEPGMQPLRKDLLEKALKHYQYFLTESGGTGDIKDEVASSRYRVGVISQTLGEYENAKRELLAARTMQQKLVDEKPTDVIRLKSLADTFNALGSLYDTNRQYDESTRMFLESTNVREQLAELQPDNVEFQRLRSNASMNLGLARVKQDDIPGGLAEMLKAQTARQRILNEQPKEVKVRRDLAKGWYSLGKTEMENKNFSAAIDHFKNAIEEFTTLRTQDPRSLELRFRLGVSFRLLGGVLGETGETEAALNAYESATTIIQSLAAGNPDVAEYQNELAVLAMNRGSGYSEIDDLPKSRNAWKEALTLTRGMIAKDIANPDLQGDLATILGSLGNVERRTGNLVEAKALFLEAKSRLKVLIDSDPQNEWFKEQWTDDSKELEEVEDELAKKTVQNVSDGESK